MTEALALEERMKVLEVGTGSGYQAAVLSSLVKTVYSIEIHEALGEKAARTLAAFASGWTATSARPMTWTRTRCQIGRASCRERV